jgi:hypothetical protein
MTCITVVEWGMEQEQREAVEPLWNKVSYLLPTYIQCLNIRYNAHSENLAQTGVLPEYRTVSLEIGPAWFAETEAERLVALRHEVLHTYIETLSVVFGDLLTAAVPDENAPLRQWGKEQWRRAEEGVISDLSRRLGAGGPT